MKLSLIALAALGVASATTVAAPADAATYMFSYTSQSGVFEGAMGSFVTDASNLVTSISGFVAGPSSSSGTITGLSNFASADNIYSSGDPHFDFSGLSFSSSAGTKYNIYSTGADLYRVSDSITDPSGGGATSADSPVTLAITQVNSAVPEPATWAMMIGGIGFAGNSLRRSRKVRTSVACA